MVLFRAVVYIDVPTKLTSKEFLSKRERERVCTLIEESLRRATDWPVGSALGVASAEVTELDVARSDTTKPAGDRGSS